MAKKRNIPHGDGPFLKKRIVELPEPIVYVACAMTPTKTFFLRILADIMAPMWVWLPSELGMYFGDLIRVNTYEVIGEVQGNEGQEAKFISARGPNPVCEVKTFTQDENNQQSRSYNHVFVNNIQRSTIAVCDVVCEAPRTRCSGSRIDVAVSATDPRIGSLLLAVHGSQINYFGNNWSCVRVPDWIEGYEKDPELRLQKEQRFDLITLLPLPVPVPKAGQWLDDGIEAASRLQNIIAAAGYYHDVKAAQMADTRTFKGRMEVAKLDDGRVWIRTKANLAEKAEQSVASVVRACQAGGFVVCKMIVDNRRTPNVRTPELSVRLFVVRQTLEEDKSLEVILEHNTKELQALIKDKVEKLDGMEATFGPAMKGSLKKETRQKLMKGEMLEVMSNFDNVGSRLLRSLWNDKVVVPLAPVIDGPSIQRNFKTMTEEQRSVIWSILRDENEVMVVDAFAGSGKTECIADAAEKWALAHAKDEQMLLVTSEMNIPLVEVVRKMRVQRRDVRILMLQSASFLADKSDRDDYHEVRLPAILNEMAASPAHKKWARPMNDAEVKVVKTALEVCSTTFAGLEMDFGLADAESATSTEKMDSMSKAIELVLAVFKPKIVAGTLSNVSRYADKLQGLVAAVVDEAGTVSVVNLTEMVLEFKNMKKLSLLGDFEQLLTKDVDTPRSIRPLGWQSVFETIGTSNGVCKLEITTTFRFSIPMISPLSEFCYGNRLRGGVPRPGLTQHFAWPSGYQKHDIVVIDVVGAESFDIMRSRTNLEQSNVAAAVCKFFELAHPELRLTLMSFYRLQLESNEQMSADTEVDSVDRFQGSETDIAVLTTTAQEANEQGKFGFIEEKRRITVALTRAREGLVIIADVSALSASGVWGDLWATLKRHKVPFIEGNVIMEHLNRCNTGMGQRFVSNAATMPDTSVPPPPRASIEDRLRSLIRSFPAPPPPPPPPASDSDMGLEHLLIPPPPPPILDMAEPEIETYEYVLDPPPPPPVLIKEVLSVTREDGNVNALIVEGNVEAVEENTRAAEEEPMNDSDDSDSGPPSPEAPPYEPIQDIEQVVSPATMMGALDIGIGEEAAHNQDGAGAAVGLDEAGAGPSADRPIDVLPANGLPGKKRRRKKLWR